MLFFHSLLQWDWEHILDQVRISLKSRIVYTDLQHCLNFLFPERRSNSELPCTLGKKIVQEQEYRILLIMPEKIILAPCFCFLEIASLTHILQIHSWNIFSKITSVAVIPKRHLYVRISAICPFPLQTNSLSQTISL